MDNNPEERPLTIGGYESAWLVDLVARFILDNAQDCFVNFRFSGIYRNDGLVIFPGDWSSNELVKWLAKFQTKVNKICETKKMIFTLDIWQPTKENIQKLTSLSKTVSIWEGFDLPYLDLCMFWDKNRNELRLKVH